MPLDEDNKQVYRKWIERLNAHDLSVIDELHSADFVDRSGTIPDPTGAGLVAALRGTFAALFTGMSDCHFEIEQLIAEGEEVGFHIRITGTHDGELFGAPATGKSITMRASGIARLKNGQFVERWETFDMLALLQQVGAV